MEDYKQTENCDLDFTDGDLVIVESTEQHQRDILLTDKGHARNKPEAGVGAQNYLSDSDPDNFLREVRKELAGDGMKVSKVILHGKDVEIDAEYGNNSQR